MPPARESLTSSWSTLEPGGKVEGRCLGGEAGGAADASATVPSLPPTRWLNTLDAAFVESRRAALECWLSELLSAGSELSLQPQLHAFLETPGEILRELMESDATPR